MTRAGYWPSDWPVDGGGSERAKTARGTGLAVGPTDRLVVTTRHTGRWPIGFIQRDRGQLYLHGTNRAAAGNGSATAGWVERVDPVTLAPVARSDDLPGGGQGPHGAIAAHANGDLYTVNGSWIHRLDADCRLVAERQLPIDRPHAGPVVLGDGSLATVDVDTDAQSTHSPSTAQPSTAQPSTLTILGPDLDVWFSTRLPEPATGRLAATSEGAAGGRGAEAIYVPGATRLFRLRWDGTILTEDPLWQPAYRSPGRGGPAGGLTIADDRVWLLDNDTGGAGTGIGPEEEAKGPAWTEPVRLMGFDITTAAADDPTIIVPTELPSGWVMAPPLVGRGIAVAWDTGNTGLAAFDVSPGAGRQMLWYQPFRSSMPPLLFPDSGELVVNDFRYLEDGSTSDDLVVLDLATGRMEARVATGAVRYGGMFLTPGWNRDLYYCGAGLVARVRVEPL